MLWRGLPAGVAAAPLPAPERAVSAESAFLITHLLQGVMRDGKLHAIPFCFDSIGLIYDTDKVKPAPTSMEVLWDPKYKGKILAYDNGEHNFSFTALTMGIELELQILNRRDCDLTQLSEVIKRTVFKITRAGELIGRELAADLGVPFGIVDISLASTTAAGDSVANVVEAFGIEHIGAHGSTLAIALLMDAVKKGGAMASGNVGGLSGTFIPVSEDLSIAAAARKQLHGAHAPTHVYERDGELVGYASLGAIPLLTGWLDHEKVSSAEGRECVARIEAIAADFGMRIICMPTTNDCRFKDDMGPMGYRHAENATVTMWFKKLERPSNYPRSD